MESKIRQNPPESAGIRRNLLKSGANNSRDCFKFETIQWLSELIGYQFDGIGFKDAEVEGRRRRRGGGR